MLLLISTLLKSKYKIHTLTFDNDKAFSLHQKIAEKLKVLTFFARPYTSQDKGTVENRIGVLRRFFPKKTNLIFVTSDEVRKIENKLNNRPMKWSGLLGQLFNKFKFIFNIDDDITRFCWGDIHRFTFVNNLRSLSVYHCW